MKKENKHTRDYDGNGTYNIYDGSTSVFSTLSRRNLVHHVVFDSIPLPIYGRGNNEFNCKFNPKL